MERILNWLRGLICEECPEHPSHDCPDPRIPMYEQIMRWARDMAEPNDWAGMFYGVHGRLPQSLDEWEAWRSKFWSELDIISPRGG